MAALALGPPFALVEACGSSPNPGVSTGGGSDSGPVSVDQYVPPSDDGGGPIPTVDAGDSGDAGSAHDASDSGDAGYPPPLCKQSATTVGAGTFVIGTPDPDLMGAVTPDDLVIAWVSVPSAGPVIYWAERATATDPFGAPQALDASFGPFPVDKISLSGDGLKLVFATPDHSQIVEVARSKRGVPFSILATAADFAGVNGSAGDGTQGIGPFGSPALSSDFRIWGFLNGPTGFVVSENSFATWTQPSFPSGLVLQDSGATLIYPTGWSADHRALFFFDTVSAIEFMAWADPATFSFGGGIPDLNFIAQASLGIAPEYAFPSGDCSRIYYSTTTPDAGSDPLDIYVSPLQ